PRIRRRRDVDDGRRRHDGQSLRGALAMSLDRSLDRDEQRILWELEQRRLITETLLDYCEYVDRNDPASLVAEVFTEDASFELGSRHAVVGREDLRRMFAKTLAGFTRTSHHLSNVRVGFDGDDRAEATAYVYAWHQTEAGRRVEVWGRYRDR